MDGTALLPLVALLMMNARERTASSASASSAQTAPVDDWQGLFGAPAVVSSALATLPHLLVQSNPIF